MMIKIYDWIKQKFVWLFIGSVAFAGGAYLVEESIGMFNNDPTYFAEIDKDDVVMRVIVASQEFIDSGRVGDPSNWVETYMDGSKRKNYAGKGYKYDKRLDAFISKKPHEDAILNEDTAQWIMPVIEVDDKVGTTTATTT